MGQIDNSRFGRIARRLGSLQGIAFNARSPHGREKPATADKGRVIYEEEASRNQSTYSASHEFDDGTEGTRQEVPERGGTACGT